MIIHLGWIGSAVPDYFWESVEAAKTAAPDCEVMAHTTEDSVPEKWRSEILPVMQSDVLRHCVLRQHGGLWLDADVRLLVSPTQWAANWTQYTAPMYAGIIGTDVIYVPPQWSGWPLIDAYIDSFFETVAKTRRMKLQALAYGMIEECMAKAPDAFQILDEPERFPFHPRNLTSESVVARNFTPSGIPPRPQSPPGLGDRIEMGLSAIGITKERVQRVANSVGIKDCGCGKRQAAANKLGAFLGLPPGSTQDAT